MKNWTRLLKRWFRPEGIRSSPIRRRQRPLVLETLEDRLAPATLTVTSAADPAVLTAGTLRYAVSQANTDASLGQSDSIVFSGVSAITLLQGQLELSSQTPAPITIDGGGKVTIDGNNASRIFQVDAGVQVSITDLTIQDGKSTGVNIGGVFVNIGGGGILNYGTLMVSNSYLVSNSALSDNSAASGGGIENEGTLTVSYSTLSRNSAGFGGGIENGGTLTLCNSTLSNNSAETGGAIANDGTALTVNKSILADNSAKLGGGGGIENQFGTLTLSYSTLSGNSATFGGGIVNYSTLMVSNSTLSDNSADEGGGIENQEDGLVTLSNSTLSGNSASSVGGGGIKNYSTLTVSNSTLADNSADYGAGIYNGYGYNEFNNEYGGSATLNNTIVANNTLTNSTSDDDLTSGFGNTFTGSYDLIGDGSYLSSFTNSVQGNPLLAPLGNYGGPTQTMPLLADSPYGIDAGSIALATSSTDQRGEGFPRVVNNTVDIGAVESNGVSLDTLLIQGLSTRSVAFQVNTVPEAIAVVDAITDLSGLIINATVSLNLAPIDYSVSGGLTVHVPGEMTLIIDTTSYAGGTGGQQATIDPTTAAFTVGSGNVVVSNVTFVTTGDAPTILVTGGSLILRDDDVEQTADSGQAALEITGGIVDLGSASDPGGNTLSVGANGVLIDNQTTSPVLAAGDTFQVNGVAVTAPQASADSYTVHENSSLIVGALGVLGNDVDPSGTALTADLATDPANGTVVLNSDGSFVYTPAANFAGTDSFTYQVENANGIFSSPATVTIDVLPSASQFVISGLPASTSVGAPQSFTVTAADSSGRVVTDYTGTVHFTSSDGLASLPADFTFTVGDLGTYTFTPEVTFATAGTQTLTATDTINSAITGAASLFVNPTIVTWTGLAGDGNWDTGGNWSTNSVPGPGDEALIPAGFTITHDHNQVEGMPDSVFSIQCAQSGIEVSGGTLAIAAPSTIDDVWLDGGTLLANANLTIIGPDAFAFPYLAAYVPGAPTSFGFTFEGGTLGGSGSVTLETTSLLGWYAVNLNVSLVNDGTATLTNNGLTLGSGVSLTNADNATLQVEFSGIINGSGTLINQAGATLTMIPTPSFDYADMDVPLSNAGTIDVEGGSLNLNGGLTNSNQVTVQSGTLTASSLSNSGSITGASGTALNLGGALTTTSTSIIQGYDVTLGGGVLSGAYSASDGTTVSGNVTFANCTVGIVGNQLDINGGSLDLTGATLVDANGNPLGTGNPLAVDDLYLNGTLLINSDLTIAGPDAFAFPYLAGYIPGAPTSFGFVFEGGTLGGSGTVTVETTSLLSWYAVNLNVSLVSDGTATVAGNGLALSSGVSLTNADNATLQVEFGGTISGSGTLINQRGATLLMLQGPIYDPWGQNYADIDVPLDNAGQVEVEGGSLNLNGGLTNSNQVTVQSGTLTASSLSNSGSITGASGTALSLGGALTTTSTSIIQGYDVTLGGGVLSGAYSARDSTTVYGDVTFANCTVGIVGNQLDINGGSLDLTGATLVDANGSPLGTGSPLTVDDLYLNGTLLINSDLTITGPDTFGFFGLASNQPGAPMAFGLVLFNGTLGGSGTATVETTALLGWYNVNVNVPIVNEGTAFMEGNYVTLGSGASFTNTNLASLQVGIGAILNGSGALVNEAGGTVLMVPSPSYPQYNYFDVYVPLDNAGLVEVEGGSLNLNGGLTNSNQVTVQSGTLTASSLNNSGSITGASGTALNLGGALTTTSTSIIQGYDVTLGGGVLSGAYSASDSTTV